MILPLSLIHSLPTLSFRKGRRARLLRGAHLWRPFLRRLLSCQPFLCQPFLRQPFLRLSYSCRPFLHQPLASQASCQREGVTSLSLKGFIALTCGLLLGLMTGCSAFPHKRPAQVYMLPSQNIEAVDTSKLAPLPLSLRINRPVAAGVLTSRKIAVLPEGSRIEVYAGSLWNAPPALMLRDHLLATLTRQGIFSSLSSDTSVLHADYALDSDLRAFHSFYSKGKPIARASLDVRLVHLASRKIIGSYQFDIKEPANGKSVEEAVAALGRAADRLTAELSLWLDTINWQEH